MNKRILIIFIVYIISVISVFADSIHQITLGEEDESVLFFNDSEIYFMLPYEKKMMKLDRKLLAYDKDGFLKLTFNGRQALIIDGQNKKQLFANFRTDGKNVYDKYSNSENTTGEYTPFYDYNVKSISASSSLKETQYGHDIVYSPINLFRAFETGCRCHPYWWNYSHIPWVEGVKGYGINETISIEFKNQVYGFSILNGYADIQNMKLFKENSRVKKLRVEDIENKLEYIMDFDDKVYFNYLKLSKPSKSVRLTILDVYKGTKYQDTCIAAMVEDIREKSNNDRESRNFEDYKATCTYSDDTALFEKYFEYVSQPLGNSSIYEKTETVKKTKNLLNKDHYWLDTYGSISTATAEDSNSRFVTLTFTLQGKKYDSQNADMYIDEYGYKHLKLFDENMEHHFTIIDTYTAKVNEDDDKWGWMSEPNTFRYAFFAHKTEFLKDDKEAVGKYFSEPSFLHNNGNNIEAYQASSYLKEGKISYEAGNTGKIYNMMARRDVTSWSSQIHPWVEGKKGDGIGESFEFDTTYPKGNGQGLPLDIRILNGYVDPLKPHLFKENNRIKKALLETDTGIKKEFEFRDEIEFTQIILPNDVKHIRLTILEVYKGTKYQDTCITSVEVNKKESER
ncbi:hypothetical protein SAMN04487775_101319 [Treponema bryantii]|uniref:NAD glycohydrolase translocation F5/8 type C domain-containing protein n=1 Tax=Treponema bryantii TaxID=163 RepID=A0A1I3I4N0_9SPIR|nr:hypothetical protein [Treponema bryantii]SFI42891.1 hypothetical protein SAMN04487775_101319 [Treponema bryantii]